MHSYVIFMSLVCGFTMKRLIVSNESSKLDSFENVKK